MNKLRLLVALLLCAVVGVSGAWAWDANANYALQPAGSSVYATTNEAASTGGQNTYVFGALESFKIVGNETDGWAIQSAQTSKYIGHQNFSHWNVNNQADKWDITPVAGETDTYYIYRHGTTVGLGWDGTPNTGILYYSDKSGNKWVITEITGVIRSALEAAIANATEKNGAAWQGTGIGYYRSLTTAIATAQGVYDKEDATQEEIDAAMEALDNAVANALIMPEAGKYYYIRSGLSNYHNQQGVYKAMYANGSNNMWNTLDDTDFNYIWTWAPKADGWVVCNAGTGKYLNTVDTMSDTEPSGTIKLVALSVAGEWNIKATGGAVMHTNGHSSGAGISGNIVGYAGGTDSGSSWMLIEVTLDEVASTVIQDAQAFVDNATVGTQPGNTPQAAINAINAAIATLNASGKTIADINAFKAAVAEAKAQSIWPVFTINSAIGYGAGKSIYEDNAGAQNHFKATDLFDSRHLWVFEGLNSETMAVGTYVIKNAVTGNVLNCGTAYPQYTVRHTGAANDETGSGQWLIYPNETSGSSSQVHAQDYGQTVVTWNSTAAGSGSCWTVSYVGTTAEIAELEAALAGYQTLVAKDAQAAAIAASIGTTPGYYKEATSGTTASVRAQFAAYDRSAIANIQAESAGFSTLAGAYDAAIAQSTIITPESGKFYAIKDYRYSTYVDGSSFPSSKVSHTEKAAAGLSAAQIWYLDENMKGYCFGTGFGLQNAVEKAGVDNAGVFTFETKDTSVSPATFAVRVPNGAQNAYWYIWANDNANYGHVDRNGNTYSATNCQFYIEEVTSLPVTIGATGYATLNLPVATTIPEGVEAWAATSGIHDDIISLTKVEGTLPANCAVILTAEAGTYSFSITTEAGTAASTFLGTVAAQAKPATGTTYVLGNKNDKVALYGYDGANLPGFKMYFHEEDAAPAEVRLQFGDIETAIKAAHTDMQEGAAYSINGQRVQKMQHGIYIVNGKKILVNK